MQGPDASSETIEVRRLVRAPQARVFAAWTTPEDLGRWWRVTPAHVPTAIAVDLRVGGTYRLGARAPNGVTYVVTGTYREISAPHRLVYTWRWIEPEPSPHESVVTVDFLARGESTEVVVSHACLPPEARPAHADGWAGCLSALIDTTTGECS